MCLLDMVMSDPVSRIFVWLIAGTTRKFREYTACLIQNLDTFRINKTYFFLEFKSRGSDLRKHVEVLMEVY